MVRLHIIFPHTTELLRKSATRPGVMSSFPAYFLDTEDVGHMLWLGVNIARRLRALV